MAGKKGSIWGNQANKTHYAKREDLFIRFINYINEQVQDRTCEYDSMERAQFIGMMAEEFLLDHEKVAKELNFTLDQLISRYMMESR